MSADMSVASTVVAVTPASVDAPVTLNVSVDVLPVSVALTADMSPVVDISPVAVTVVADISVADTAPVVTDVEDTSPVEIISDELI